MKIFILLSRMPYPLEKGDKLRAFQQIKALSQKHDIHLFALNPGQLHPDALEHLKPYCKSIKVVMLSRMHIFLNLLYTVFRRLPFQVGYFYSPSIAYKIREKIKQVNPDVIFCQLVRVAEYVKDIKDIPRIIDYQDVFSRGMEQRAEKAFFVLRPFLNFEARLLKKYENKVFDWFDERIIISGQDRSHIPHPDRERIRIVPNSIDRSKFQPAAGVKDTDLLFVGNMNYEPNIDCAVYLVREILPLVRKQLPGLKLEIAGADPSYRVTSMASESVKITGWVNNMSRTYAKAKVFCAPMRMGTGLQNKLLEAMAMKVPCVTTSLCNNALRAEPGKSILIGDEPQSFADHIVTLLKDENKAAVIAENAYHFILEHYDSEVIGRLLENLLDGVKNKKA